MLCPEEAEQYGETCEGENQTDEEPTKGILCIRGEDIAIDVQDKVYDETDQQEPSSIEPLLYPCEVLMSQTAQDEEEEIAPIDDAEQTFYGFGYGDGIGDGCIIDGQEGYAHQEHHNVCIFAEQELCQSIKDEVLEEDIGEPVSCFHMTEEGRHEIYVHHVDKECEEDDGGDDLHHELLAKELNSVLEVPYNACLVEHKTADEIEHGHSDLHEVAMNGVCAQDAPHEECDMMDHNENHGKSSQSIDVLYALFFWQNEIVCFCELFSNEMYSCQNGILQHLLHVLCKTKEPDRCCYTRQTKEQYK